MGFLEFLFFLLFSPIIYASEHCSIAMCGSNDIPIRFPFRLEGHQSQICGYPGFILRCESQAVLKLPYSGEFFVRDINYRTQQILLYDQDNCLPRRLLGFNLSDSPFVAAFYQNYTFLSCPSQLTKSWFTPIACLSNSTNSVLATSSKSLAKSMSASCKIIATLQVPVSWSAQFEEGFSNDLNEDIQLTWYVPDCEDCEAVKGGMCRFKSNTSQEIACSYNHKKGHSRDGLHVFRIITLSIALPAISCAVGIACCLCFMDRSNTTRRNSTTAVVSPQSATVVMGLDESTIESYTKLVLGESRRLPGLNDTTCPICLSEYHTKETLRCIPECKHCFHADCIDEWLRMNNTCPVCRNSPSPAHVNSDHV